MFISMESKMKGEYEKEYGPASPAYALDGSQCGWLFRDPTPIEACVCGWDGGESSPRFGHYNGAGGYCCPHHGATCGADHGESW